MPCDRRQDAAGHAHGDEEDATTSRRPRLLLMALRQFGLDHLTSLPASQHPNGERKKKKRDHVGDREGEQGQRHRRSSLTTSSRRRPCAPLTRTRSPARALFLIHATAAAWSETTSAPADSARMRPLSLSTTATVSNTSAAWRPISRCDSSVNEPSSRISPNSARSRPCRGRCAITANAARIDSGLAL